MKTSALLLMMLAGCGRLVGGRCDEGWSPRGIACDAGTSRDVTTSVDRASTDDVAPRDASVDLGADTPATDVPPLSDVRPVTDATPLPDVALAPDVGVDAGRVCTPPERTCDGRCVDFTADPLHCGACGRPCPAGAFCVGGACNTVCGEGRIRCPDGCVDPQTDPQNCGTCGVVCPSGLCNGGRCRDERVGHLVLIGHDLAATRPDQTRLVGNAAFLTLSLAPRVVLFTPWSEPASVDAVEAAIRSVAGPRAVMLQRITAVEELEAALSIDRSDVVFVPHQVGAAPGQIASVARRVSARVVAFARAGGAFVVLDGGTGDSATWPFAERTALLNVAGTEDVTGAETELVNAADALAVGVSGAWRAERRSVGFTGTDGRAWVVRARGLPLALHEVVRR
jgi:hypothetical protein